MRTIFKYSAFLVLIFLSLNSCKSPCEKCEGEGSYNCTKCEGEGEITCSVCDGEGTSECHRCNGTGEDDCGNCHGSGTERKYDYSSDEYREMTCEDYNGSRK